MSKGRQTKKIRQLDPKFDALAKELLRRHIPYEVNMLRATYKELLAPSPSRLIRNVVIESFHIHARNLIEFFKNDKQCVVDPRRYMTPDYRIDGDFIARSLETRISQQIVHLTAQRIAGKGQLDNPERDQTVTAIEQQISRFEKHLTKEWQKIWEEGLREMIVVDTMISVAEVQGASSEITALPQANMTGSVGDSWVVGSNK
jgi:hypothetical protein